MSAVLGLYGGAVMESTSRRRGVTAATLSEWREVFLAAGAEGLRNRQENLVDGHGCREKRVIAWLAMANKLLRERIWCREDENRDLGWRSKR